MRRVFTAILVLGAVLKAQSKLNMDSEKIVVAVLPLESVSMGAGGSRSSDSNTVALEAIFESKEALEGFADAATQKVINAFVKTKRCRVIERGEIGTVLQEQNFQMSDNAKRTAEIGELMGAQFVLVGQVQQVSVQRVTEDNIDGTPRTAVEFNGLVELNLRLVDVATGEVTASKGLKGATGFLYQKTPSEAAMWALNQAEKEVVQWLRNLFPVEGRLVEVSKEKKGEALEVLVSCGKDLGVRKDDIFRVFVEREVDVDGKMLKRSEDVGRVTIKKLTEDGNFATAVVDKGGKAIVRLLGEGVRIKVAQAKK